MTGEVRSMWAPGYLRFAGILSKRFCPMLNGCQLQGVPFRQAWWCADRSQEIITRLLGLHGLFLNLGEN